MSDVNSFIMSLDYTQILPIGLAATMGASLIAYKILKINQNRRHSIIQDRINNLDYENTETTIDKEELEENLEINQKEFTQTLFNSNLQINNNQPNIKEEPKIENDDSLFSELLNESKESRLNEDTINNFNTQFNQQLPVSTQNTSHEEILFQQLHEQGMQADQQRNLEDTQYNDVINNEFKEVINNQPINNYAYSPNHTNQNAEMGESILNDFGDLASQLQKDNVHPANSESAQTTFYVWANYMSMKNGKMNLQNTLLQLNNPWGTVDSISELKNLLEQEVGLDSMGNKQSWAIISVTPVKN